jgi:hypothetical protein
MIFTKCPISRLFTTSCRPENGSKMNFATEPDRELRSPFPSEPQFAPDSKIWQHEHAVACDAEPATPGRDKVPVAKTSYDQRLEFQ